MTTASPVSTASRHPFFALSQRVPPGLFAGQCIWVTGGGSGIGRCVAHELASLGADVVISRPQRRQARARGRRDPEDGGRCAWRAFDIRDEDAVKADVADVRRARTAASTALVNNAGGQFPAPLMAISAAAGRRWSRNNLTGGFLMAREMLPAEHAARTAARSST